MRGPDGRAAFLLLGARLRILLVDRERGDRDQRPAVAVDDVGALREGERFVAVRLADRHGQAGGQQPPGREEPEREGVRADARADGAARGTAETEREGDLIVVHPRVPVRGRHELRVARVDFDEVAACELHLVETARRDRERPAPGDAGNGIGQFVEPAVVGRAPVRQREVRIQLQLEARRSPGAERGEHRTRAGSDRSWGGGGSRRSRAGVRRCRGRHGEGGRTHCPALSTSFHAVSNAGVAGSSARRAPHAARR